MITSAVPRPPYPRLWWEGFRCGLINAPRGGSHYQRIQAARLLLCPVDFWRYAEFGAVLRGYSGGRTVLDIGSPKVAALYLARRHGAQVTCVDIADTLHEECAVYQRAAPRGTILPRHADATGLPFADEFFDFVYSVSVIEHIPGDGDTQAMREIARVLRPGGRAVITIPMWREPGEIWQETDPFGQQPRDEHGRIFFSRIYDYPLLRTRIVDPAPLRLIASEAWEVTHPVWFMRYQEAINEPRTLRAIWSKLFEPWHAWRHMRAVAGPEPGVRNRGIAALLFEKPMRLED